MVAAALAVFVIGGAFLVYVTGHRGGAERTFNVTVTGAKAMSPVTLSAHQNDSITINLTSDTDGEVHLHEYDVHFSARAGQTVTRTFKADKTCDCEIEWESTSTKLGRLVVSP